MRIAAHHNKLIHSKRGNASIRLGDVAQFSCEFLLTVFIKRSSGYPDISTPPFVDPIQAFEQSGFPGSVRTDD